MKDHTLNYARIFVLVPFHISGPGHNRLERFANGSKRVVVCRQEEGAEARQVIQLNWAHVATNCGLLVASFSECVLAAVSAYRCYRRVCPCARHDRRRSPEPAESFYSTASKELLVSSWLGHSPASALGDSGVLLVPPHQKHIKINLQMDSNNLHIDQSECVNQRLESQYPDESDTTYPTRRNLSSSQLKASSYVISVCRVVFVMWLASSPPTKAIRVQSPAGSLRIFACGNRRVFSGISRFLPPFNFGDAPYSPQSHSSAFTTSMLRAVHISPPTHPPSWIYRSFRQSFFFRRRMRRKKEVKNDAATAAPSGTACRETVFPGAGTVVHFLPGGIVGWRNCTEFHTPVGPLPTSCHTHLAVAEMSCLSYRLFTVR
ncbi:hypothetical protein PR048_002859 [Dryococelus australis]|uniref:Uncharacterized protein n=1 Tax=Dryococelus australis TaxID=614101 RepID=A0ABQ9ILG2_9NEOP|nr:hypothetical protein PR048_002859 [Dryococelus australis]